MSLDESLLDFSVSVFSDAFFSSFGTTLPSTRLGTPLRYGVVAVDPKVIPLGTKLYIEGYGYAVAEDTGGAIKGNRIDLCFTSRAQADNFGRRNVKVYILK